jgi:hypothetical protein
MDNHSMGLFYSLFFFLAITAKAMPVIFHLQNPAKAEVVRKLKFLNNTGIKNPSARD